MKAQIWGLLGKNDGFGFCCGQKTPKIYMKASAISMDNLSVIQGIKPTLDLCCTKKCIDKKLI